MATREYFDKDRPVMDACYELITESGKQGKELEAGLKELIKQDKDFLDPYTILFDYYLDEDQPLLARNIMTEAYDRAISLITDKKGSWPSLIEWAYLENRHILRALCNYGILFWTDNKTDQTIALFRKVLTVCPRDNMGVRFMLLGVLTGLDYSTYEERFEGEVVEDEFEWFETEAKKFKQDFSEYL